jgi:hypothetical protein
MRALIAEISAPKATSYVDGDLGALQRSVPPLR